MISPPRDKLSSNHRHEMSAAEKPIKLLLLGDAGVGKTNLTYAYMNGVNAPPTTTSTIGVDYSATMEDVSQFFPPALPPSASPTATTTTTTTQGLTARWRRLLGHPTDPTNPASSEFVNPPTDIQQVRLQIWDTGGQERFRSIITAYYHHCDGIVLVCDLTRRETLTNLTQWLREYDAHAANPWRKTPRVVIANKSDLFASGHTGHIAPEELEAFAHSLEAPYFITTCRGSIASLREPFIAVAGEAFKERLRRPAKTATDPPLRLESDHTRHHSARSRCCAALKKK